MQAYCKSIFAIYIKLIFALYTKSIFPVYTKSLFAIYTKSIFATYICMYVWFGIPNHYLLYIPNQDLLYIPNHYLQAQKCLETFWCLWSLCCTYFSICDNMMKCSMMNTSYIQWRWLQIYLWEKNLYDTFRSRNVHRTSSLSVDWLLQVLTRIETLLY